MLASATPQDDSATLLVVDDDRDIRMLLANSLGSRGYKVETASNTRDMDQILSRTPVDLVIMDIMMPGEDGLSACRRIARTDGPEIIFLSALGEEQDRILGLEVGAGHYLPKPCSPREILATVRAALRKRGAVAATSESGDVYTFEGWRIDLGSHELFDPNGVLVGLTDGEFAVLRVFIERPRRVLSREALLAAARGPDSDAYDRAIDVQVSRLRRKLRSGGDEIIRTVRNEGYLFVPKVVRA
ncbi:response regulator [Sphingomonas kyeonggiensis]|jgi:two-component system OmpR family response regulator|uniref:response regulator n=1 Tax=Sphingomonas kyeonggiensis TaxID=1268553 RepID=UPI001608BC8E|nr:response regulator [Sphingomonas kyeonggiensis]